MFPNNVLIRQPLWPEGFNGNFRWSALALTIVAAVALFRYKRGVIEVLLFCGVCGLGLTLAG